MKQRITYVVEKPDEFSPEQLSVRNNDESSPRFVLQGVHAAKEHRITLGLEELPEELSRVFQKWHELHIRWASSASFVATPPFTSRVSPGLNVFFTPLESTSDGVLCEQLHSLIGPGLKCSSMNESAIELPVFSKRFSMSTTSQYYAYLESIKTPADNIAEKFCQGGEGICQRLGKELLTAASLDIDYDTVSRTVTLTALWPSAPDNEGWSEGLTLPHKKATVEIGVLSHEFNADPKDIQFGGFLTVLGQDTKPKPTRFQTPTRHYPLLDPTSPPLTPNPHPLTYTASFSQPTGLHPTLVLSLPARHLTPPSPSCKLHTYLTLPSALFLDKYQFQDALYLASKHITHLHHLAGATDLEAPDWVVPQWGSTALFELATPPPTPDTDSETEKSTGPALPKQWNISIPLHLRYLPAAPSTHSRLPLPWPPLFWACRDDADEDPEPGTQPESETESVLVERAELMAANPFDRVHVGYEALFPPDTQFLHVSPGVGGVSSSNGRHNITVKAELVEWLDVPVLDTRETGWVEGATVGVVGAAFLGLCFLFFWGRARGNTRGIGGEREKKRQ